MNETEFSHWFITVGESLLNQLVRKTGAPLEDAKDALQDVVLKFLKNGIRSAPKLIVDESGECKLSSGVPFFSFVRTAAINRAIDLRRHQHGDRFVGGVEDRADQRFNESRVTEHLECEEAFRQCLAKLKDADIKSLRLRFCESAFQLPRPPKDGGARPVPRHIDRLRRCMDSRGVTFRYLIDLLPNLAVILCGEIDTA